MSSIRGCSIFMSASTSCVIRPLRGNQISGEGRAAVPYPYLDYYVEIFQEFFS
jgi:hypothetical protein